MSIDPADPLFGRPAHQPAPTPVSSPEPTQPAEPHTPEPRRADGLGDALRTSRRRTPPPLTPPEAKSSSAPGPPPPATLHDASLTPAPSRPETLDDAYRVRNGREVRDTRWTRLLDSTWNVLTSTAGRLEQVVCV